MITITLSLGKSATIDDIDAERVLAHTWHARKTRRGVYYAATNMPDGGRYKYTPLHRFLMNPPTGFEVDHIDGDGLNNTRANLRVCTHAENMKNRRGFGVSRFLGVAYDPRSKVSWWVAQCGQTYLGRFATEVEAAAAYDCAAIKKYGEFARPNFSDADRPSFRRTPSRRKLTPEQVAEIRKIGRSMTLMKLGEKFGVSHRMISLILLGQAHNKIATPVPLQREPLCSQDDSKSGGFPGKNSALV